MVKYRYEKWLREKLDLLIARASKRRETRFDRKRIRGFQYVIKTLFDEVTALGEIQRYKEIIQEYGLTKEQATGEQSLPAFLKYTGASEAKFKRAG